MDIGRADTIRKARLKRGMAASELARRLGVSRQTIHSWETSDSVEIKPSNMRRLARLLDLPSLEAIEPHDTNDYSGVNETRPDYHTQRRPVGVHMLETAIELFSSRLITVSNELHETRHLSHEEACQSAEQIAQRLTAAIAELESYVEVAKRAFKLELNP